MEPYRQLKSISSIWALQIQSECKCGLSDTKMFSSERTELQRQNNYTEQERQLQSGELQEFIDAIGVSLEVLNFPGRALKEIRNWFVGRLDRSLRRKKPGSKQGNPGLRSP